MRRALSGLVALLVLGAVGFIYFAQLPAIPPRTSETQGFEPGTIAKGGELAKIGNCNVCHTKSDGAPYAGGRPMQTPFGTIHATNITPDRETGIGAWSEAAFMRAMREGVRRDGATSTRPSPTTTSPRLHDDDLRAALRVPDDARAGARRNAAQRRCPFRSPCAPLIAGWKLLFFEPGEHSSPIRCSAPSSTAAPIWSKGSPIAAPATRRATRWAPSGTTATFGGGEAEGWHAPALNAASPAPVPVDRRAAVHLSAPGLRGAARRRRRARCSRWPTTSARCRRRTSRRSPPTSAPSSARPTAGRHEKPAGHVSATSVAVGRASASATSGRPGRADGADDLCRRLRDLPRGDRPDASPRAAFTWPPARSSPCRTRATWPMSSWRASSRRWLAVGTDAGLRRCPHGRPGRGAHGLRARHLQRPAAPGATSRTRSARHGIRQRHDRGGPAARRSHDHAQRQRPHARRSTRMARRRCSTSCATTSG